MPSFHPVSSVPTACSLPPSAAPDPGVRRHGPPAPWRPARDRPDATYLLSGIATRSVCGGSVMAFTRGANHRTRGHRVTLPITRPLTTSRSPEHLPRREPAQHRAVSGAAEGARLPGAPLQGSPHRPR
jgi:hypothetical protein